MAIGYYNVNNKIKSGISKKGKRKGEELKAQLLRKIVTAREAQSKSTHLSPIPEIIPETSLRRKTLFWVDLIPANKHV